MLFAGDTEKDADWPQPHEGDHARVARRARRRDRRKEEFRARLGVENERRAHALDDIVPGRAAVSLGVPPHRRRQHRTRGKQYLFNLNLDNVETGKV